MQISDIDNLIEYWESELVDTPDIHNSRVQKYRTYLKNTIQGLYNFKGIVTVPDSTNAKYFENCKYPAE